MLFRSSNHRSTHHTNPQVFLPPTGGARILTSAAATTPWHRISYRPTHRGSAIRRIRRQPPNRTHQPPLLRQGQPDEKRRFVRQVMGVADLVSWRILHIAKPSRSNGVMGEFSLVRGEAHMLHRQPPAFPEPGPVRFVSGGKLRREQVQAHHERSQRAAGDHHSGIADRESRPGPWGS